MKQSQKVYFFIILTYTIKVDSSRFGNRTEFMKMRSIRYVVLMLSILFGSSCKGMWMVSVVQTMLPFAPYIYVAYKMVQSKINRYRRLEEQLEYVHGDVKRVDMHVSELTQKTVGHFKETCQDIKDSKRDLSTKIDKTNNDLSQKLDKTNDQLAQRIDETKDVLLIQMQASKREVVEKIDTARDKLEELINAKVEDAKASINSHIGLTRFDMVKNVQMVKEEFKKRFDTIDRSLDQCVTLGDAQAAEERVALVIKDMNHLLGDAIEKSEQNIISSLKAELSEKVTFLDTKNMIRFKELQKEVVELKSMVMIMMQKKGPKGPKGPQRFGQKKKR